MLLPFIEQTGVYSHCNFLLQPAEGANADVVRTPLSVFRCPSDPGPTDQALREYQSGDRVTLPHGNIGLNDEINNQTSFRDVQDGLSNTIMLGETIICTMDEFGYILRWSATWSSRIMGAEQNGVYAFNPDVLCGTIARPGQGMPTRASSYHPGGAQFALFDGSSRFISETIDQQTLTNLAKLNDGNPVGPF